MLMQTHESRLEALRKELRRQELDGFVVPISDEHMSEYVGEYAQRLHWLTGFEGSAGAAALLNDEAAIFVDGRYTAQVRDQVDGKLFQYKSVPADNMGEWLGQNAEEGARIAYDPWLHTRGWAQKLAATLAKYGVELVEAPDNPIDHIWEDQPQPSAAPAFLQDDALAGQTSADKRAAIAEWLKAEGLDGTVISALDSVAWLLNIRGEDVARTPVALSYVVVNQDGTADWFIDPRKVPEEVSRKLGNAVRIRQRSGFEGVLRSEYGGRRIAVDPERTVAAVFQALEAGRAETVEAMDPAVLPKAIKNETEIAGQRASQARDGAAVANFLHWISVEAPKGAVDELSAAEKLQDCREACGDLRDLSFDTISGSGPNGANPHYRVNENTNRTLEPNSVYLVDSGGQYPDGTTDITRTVWIGPDAPPAEVKDRFTRVLKGHIALDRQIFPAGTSGAQLDTLARQYLWMAGVDYGHGTGHGVGSFLAVHEGPQRISKPRGGQAGTDQELFAGMILSNEPGYYKPSAFGIRIENLILVEPRAIEGAEGDYFGFETLTLVPIDRNLVDVSLLREEEIAWWNDYHAKVHECLAPQLEGDARVWLDEACKAL
ncbi:aminopeptidase P family protein [Altericroceibacterium endophyticum]|uniref:M24 family metallopeptidase n=1 Tax=Altericroceibacterium endophyticum TaxID=1808508 RepID=A0A6I4T3J2_9SPHN|nr:aminopeptidase P family protein [Altericroceibacterium endophyticum]MXO65844.1 M24 family metallopeptidase [Altericroceibacterium endophyticum]